MRSVARIKLGYYPLPEAEGERIRRLLLFPAERVSALDPCAGTGAALLQLTHGANVELHGVELDSGRAESCQAAGIQTTHGNIFDVQSKSGMCSLLYLNPPYDSEVASFGNRRMELLFLQKTHRWLAIGGVLVMVVPHEQLHACADVLAEAFSGFRVMRLSDPEADRFDQVLLMAVRSRVKSTDYQRNRQKLIAAIWAKDMPLLTGDEEPLAVPAAEGTVAMEYRGLPLDQVEDMVLSSNAWGKVRACLLPSEDVSVGRPITPLHGGHVGLLCTAGLLNGVFGNGEDRHIARWRTVKYVTTYEEKINGFTEIHKRERFSNELALIYENGKTLILTDEKKEAESDAERTSRLARLDYVRSSVKTQTSISVHVSHFIGEAEQAHLLSFFGNDAEVGAVTAAIQEGHRFDLFTLDGKKQRIGFGAEPSVYKAALSLPRQRRTLRHVVAVSSWLHANGSAGRTFLLNGQEEADAMSWAALVSLQGLPAHPSWAHHVLGNLRAEGKIKPLNGVGCSPAAVEITREELMERMGKALRYGHLPFPADSGPVRWPEFALRDCLADAA